MESFLPELTNWITQYGSFALFILLMLGIFALPIPDETLMVVSGVLLSKGQLELIPTAIAAFAGACCGITISYLIGKTAGAYLIKKFGPWIGITAVRMQRVHDWFERIGRWTLLVGYFIPGVRHLTGYAAGVTLMEYRHFALFSYTGAAIWVTTFLSIGYFVGNKWHHIYNTLESHWYELLLATLGIAALISFIFWLRAWRSKGRKSKTPSP